MGYQLDGHIHSVTFALLKQVFDGGRKFRPKSVQTIRFDMQAGDIGRFREPDPGFLVESRLHDEH
ncbi:MAG TPA: hypothetical protein VME40_12805 [Caulobacteraceae bacterium]|nr:hypothetical protein [Caulobacteraceae bacterium]